MRPITDLNELKSIELDILSDIDGFCRDEGLDYFLAYGTLLGAIRHKGFIPWDDDIDIAMPRPHYERFIATYRNRDRYQALSPLVTPGYLLPYTKVIDTRTGLVDSRYRKEPAGVFVDVFPIDGYDPSKRQFQRAGRLIKLLHTKKAAINGSRSFAKNTVLVTGKCVLFPVSANTLLRRLNANATSVDYVASDHVANFTLNIYGARELMVKSIVETTIDARFEDRTFRIPSGYHEYLTGIYGDYMTPPPPEKQVSLHGFDAWWTE